MRHSNKKRDNVAKSRPGSNTVYLYYMPTLDVELPYYGVPISRACTAIYLRGKCSPTRPYYALHAY